MSVSISNVFKKSMKALLCLVKKPNVVISKYITLRLLSGMRSWPFKSVYLFVLYVRDVLVFLSKQTVNSMAVIFFPEWTTISGRWDSKKTDGHSNGSDSQSTNNFVPYFNLFLMW